MKAKNFINIKELEGKDIIDADGEKVGKVDSLQVDITDNRVVGIMAKEDDLSAKLGLGESRVIPIDSVQALGENVVLK